MRSLWEWVNKLHFTAPCLIWLSGFILFWRALAWWQVEKEIKQSSIKTWTLLNCGLSSLASIRNVFLFKSGPSCDCFVQAERKAFSSLCPNFTHKASIGYVSQFLSYPNKGRRQSIRTAVCFASLVKVVRELNNSCGKFVWSLYCPGHFKCCLSSSKKVFCGLEVVILDF